MLQKYSCLTATLSLLLTLVSCDKVPINGDLDGMWQLTSITTPDTHRDMKPRRIYIGFELHLTQWDDPSNEKRYFSHFTHSGDSLIFFDITYASNYAADDNRDELVTPKEMHEGLFDSWGIHCVNPRYRILKFNSSTLELQQADTLVVYRKF